VRRKSEKSSRVGGPQNPKPHDSNLIPHARTTVPALLWPDSPPVGGGYRPLPNPASHSTPCHFLFFLLRFAGVAGTPGHTACPGRNKNLTTASVTGPKKRKPLPKAVAMRTWGLPFVAGAPGLARGWTQRPAPGPMLLWAVSQEIRCPPPKFFMGGRVWPGLTRGFSQLWPWQPLAVAATTFGLRDRDCLGD